MMRAALLAAFAMLCALPARADDSLTFQYSRSDIAIVRSQPPVPLPWLNQPANPELLFDVEVHDATAAYNRNVRSGQTGWFNLSSPEENRGVMVMFKSPQLFPLSRSSDYAPLDVLMVDESGIVSQILPEIKLASLQQDIVPQKPVKAFLFIQGGLARRMFINTGDRIESPLFNKASVLIDKDPYPALKPAAGEANTQAAPRMLVPQFTVPK